MLPDAFGAVAELAATQHGALSSRQAAALGIPGSTIRSWVRRGRLWQPAPGALVVPGSPLTWRAHLAIATFAHTAAAVISHRAAARLHGLDGFDEAALELTTRRGRRLALPGFVQHTTDTLGPADVVILDGIRVTSIARTLADLGAVVGEDRVWQAADDAVRRGASRRWIEEVLTRAERPGPSGTGALRRVIEEHRRLGATDSFFETRLLAQLARHDLPAPVPQFPIRDAAGELVAVVDVAFPSIRVAVEAHSKRFHFGERMNVRDADREHEIAKLGWDVVFVLHRDVDAGRAGDKVASFVAARRPPDIAA